MNLSVLTKREVIQSVARRWREQYSDDYMKHSPEKMEILVKLEKLDLNKASPETIGKIIGNNSWSQLECGGCERDVKKVVIYERYNDSIRLCAACLKHGLNILEDA